MRLRSKLAVRAAKLTSTAIKKFHMGSGVTLPGLVARIIDPKILSEMSAQIGKKTIVTMGTNGKTTTNSLLCKVLEDAGHTVIINRTGANMLNGIISAFVLSTDKQGLIHADYACIEVDEIASVGVLPQLQPDCALLTNISRDQLDRFGEVDITYNMVKTAIHSVPKTKLILNCDDVLSYTLAMEGENPYVTYGINEQIFDDFSRSEIRESIFCRHCGTKLSYDFFHYGQLGVYRCPNCGLAHPTPDYTATNVLFHDEVYDFSIDDIMIHSSARSPYNIYNTLSAYAALQALEADLSGFKNTIEHFDYGNNRESIFTINGARVQLHLAKNPIGFQQKISLVLKDTSPKDVIIQINDTYQDGEDISWLWDVDFQYLADANVNTILTAGTRKYDMGLRLKYEDIACDSTADLRASILDLTQNSTKNLYVIVNYSGLYRTNHLLTALQEETRGMAENTMQTEDNVPSENVTQISGNAPSEYTVHAETSTPMMNATQTDGDQKLDAVQITNTPATKLTIGHLYPDLLNLYGDRGNIQCLRKRLEWRGIEAEVIPFLSGDEIDFSKLDIVLLGGGSDREQELVCEYLKDIRDDFKAYVEHDGVVLAVCGGYQLLGNYYKTDKKMIEGLGILDITTEWQPKRLIRNIILNSTLFETPVVGFENHGGRTYIGSHTPFGKVFFGLGNTGKSGYEGVVYKNVIATYLHGPLLPKNPHVCDNLLKRALMKKYGEDISLAPLSDELEHKANRYLVDRYSDKKYVLKETIKRYT